MAISNLKPKVWSAELLVALEKSLVYAGPGVVNRDYEGEIAEYGDTVHVIGLADPTIGTYTAHTDITIEDIDDTDNTLVVNQSDYFAFEMDDIEKRQAINSGGALSEQARKAGYLLRDKADQYVAGLMSTAVPSGNKLTGATITSADQAYNLLVDLQTVLDAASVPEEGRFVIVTPTLRGWLRKDTRFIASGDDKAATVRVNGIIGEAAGLSVRVSNNAPAGASVGGNASKRLIAGSAMATSYAEQIAKTEADRMEKRFADLVKGLHLYGGKVFRPSALASVDVN